MSATLASKSGQDSCRRPVKLIVAKHKLIDAKLELLTREQGMLEKMAEEKERDADIQTGLEEFATLVSNNLRHISFENKQKLLRMVLDKVVVKDWRVDLYYNIPLPKPAPPPKKTPVSSKLSLCSTSRLRKPLDAYAICIYIQWCDYMG